MNKWFNLASWLRITYLFGTCLNEQLRALRVFLQSSTGNKYLSEFLDVGGLFTLLEILNVNQIKDEDKLQAVSISPQSKIEISTIF